MRQKRGGRLGTQHTAADAVDAQFLRELGTASSRNSGDFPPHSQPGTAMSLCCVETKGKAALNRFFVLFSQRGVGFKVDVAWFCFSLPRSVASES